MEKMAHFFSFKTSGKVRINWGTIGLILILLLGFFLRIYRIKDYITFLGDEGRDALVVYNILHADLTLLGPTSSVGGFFLGPIYYYFMAPFLWIFNYDPVGPAIMVALFGLATIYLVYAVGKEFFNEKAAFAAALLYAMSPIVTIYSRSSWNPNIMPFFSLSALYIIYKAVSGNKAWLFVFCGILLGISMQLHYLATFVGVIIFFYVLLAQFKLSLSYLILLIKRYILLFTGFIIGFSPFLIFEVRHGFVNTLNIITFIFCSGETQFKFPFCPQNLPLTGVEGDFFTNIGHVFLRLFGGLVIFLPNPDSFWKYSKVIVQIWHSVSIILGLSAILVFVFWFLKRLKDKEYFEKYLLLFLWGLIGLILFGLYKKAIYDYYLGFIFPLPFLLVGFLLSFLLEKLKKFGIVIFIVFLLSASYINLKSTPIAFFPNKQVDQVKKASEFVLSKTNGKPFNFGIIGGGNSDHAYRYFFRLAGRDPVVIQGLDIDPQRKSVTEQLFVVCERASCSPLGESSQEIAGFGRAEVVGEWQVIVLKIYKLVHYKGS